jgi:hypothetical protein
LGLTDHDEVHRVLLVGAEVEEAVPAAVTLMRPAWVEFVSADWRVHSIRFETDSLLPEGASFLRDSDQMASPLLVEKDARYVVSFHDAPPGLYRFVLEGNGRPGYGVVVVERPGR